MTTPLPCPFCGETPTTTKHFKLDLHCLVHRCHIVGPIGFEFSDRDYVVSKWNTRHTPTVTTSSVTSDFVESMSDFHASRTVDLDKALTEKPMPTADDIVTFGDPKWHAVPEKDLTSTDVDPATQ